ncbi:hypothetical protein BH09PSE3_BH09PSE3_24540 [soil metagenome]
MTPILKLMIAASAVFLTTAAEAPLAALSQIEPGQWFLNTPGARPRSICVADTRVLLQLQHQGVVCSRYVIANDKDVTVVHYTCPGAGHGRTEIKVETPRLIQVMSQGIFENAPFEWTLEGRRTGSCTTPPLR